MHVTQQSPWTTARQVRSTLPSGLFDCIRSLCILFDNDNLVLLIMGASLDVPLVGVKLPLIMLHLLRGVPGSSISENEIFEDNLGKI